MFCQVQRSDPEAVACQGQFPADRIPYGERESATPAGVAGWAPRPGGVGQHVGSTAGGAAPAQQLELLAQFREVVDLAVLNQPVAAIVAADRLSAPSLIDDRQSGVHHAERTVKQKPRSVWPPVLEFSSQRQEQLPVSRLVVPVKYPRDSAHAGRLSPHCSAPQRQLSRAAATWRLTEQFPPR